MLGKELGHEILASQTKYNTDYKETDQTIIASYTLEDMILDNVEKTKFMYFLSITITNDLKWNAYASNICTKSNRTLGLLAVTWRHVQSTLKSHDTRDCCQNFNQGPGKPRSRLK